MARVSGQRRYRSRTVVADQRAGSAIGSCSLEIIGDNEA